MRRRTFAQPYLMRAFFAPNPVKVSANSAGWVAISWATRWKFAPGLSSREKSFDFGIFRLLRRSAGSAWLRLRAGPQGPCWSAETRAGNATGVSNHRRLFAGMDLAGA